MASLMPIYAVVIFVTLAEAAGPPVWPKAYKVAGNLKLPYAEINENFTGWFELTKNRSRVDYYGSTVSTIQIGFLANNTKDYGKNFKIAPVFMGGKNKVACFLVKGSADSPVGPQALLPNLTGFNSSATSVMHGKKCSVWKNVVKNGNKISTYTMWIDQNSKPVRYEMMGYDSLLGSHFDKYYVDYTAYSPQKSIPDATFVPAAKNCGPFPGPGDSEHRITMNPMMEYINGDDTHADDMFEHFKKTHKKSYKDASEHNKRKHVFRQNLRFVTSKNRAGLSYALKINHLADRTDEEMKVMRGYKRSTQFDPEAIQFDITKYNLSGIPQDLDWRIFGAVTPVKDQAVCGSCWSFGTTGTIEGAYFLNTQELVRLSQQELMDCSWDQGNNACDGGEDFRSYQWIKKKKVPTATLR